MEELLQAAIQARREQKRYKMTQIDNKSVTSRRKLAEELGQCRDRLRGVEPGAGTTGPSADEVIQQTERVMSSLLHELKNIAFGQEGTGRARKQPRITLLRRKPGAS